MKESFSKVNKQIEETYTLVDSVVQEASNEEKMIDGINKLMEENNRLSVKNSEVAKSTDSISKDILLISKELKEDVETTKEKA
jgi:methyl-accepting chemotaxis protein